MISIGLVSGIIVMLCWGIGDFLASILTKKIGTIKTMFVNNVFWLIISIPLAFYIYFNNLIKITWIDFFLICLSSFIDIFAVYNFLKSLEFGEVTIVSPISSAYSLITVILALLLLNETLSLLRLVSILIIIIGIILSSADLSKLKNLHTAKGVKQALIAMVLWGIYFFILGIVKKSTDSINIFLFSFTTIAIFFTIFAILKKGMTNYQELAKQKLVLIFIIGNILFLLAWIVMSYALPKENISILTPLSSLYSAITVVLAAIFYKEKLVFNQKIGIVVILAGIVLISI